MKKRIISVIIVITLIISSLALSITAFGSSQELVLNVTKSATISGADDLEWFYYTPAASGTYSLLSYNIPACECYLFIKERQEDGSKKYVQLAYSKSDENYEENGHNVLQFCLTYHLEQGVTYYYAAGWLLSQSRVDGAMTVMLRNDSYDNTAIESIEVGEPITLEAYTDGMWATDANKQSYFRYNTARIVANLSITLHYSDGTSTTQVGKDVIDGYEISFVDNQYEKHWYPDEDPEYNGNTLIIKVLSLSTSINIPITIGSRYSYKGTVVDMAGAPVKNANVYIGTQKMAQTNDEGYFSFYYAAGEQKLTISTTHSIDRTIGIVISVDNSSNDHTATPISLCNCDFVKDGFINAKDFAFINRYADEADKPLLIEEFHNSINFTADKY